jgi:hypothetical protein
MTLDLMCHRLELMRRRLYLMHRRISSCVGDQNLENLRPSRE